MFFVTKQSNLEDLPSEKLVDLETKIKGIEEENKALGADVKAAQLGMGARTVPCSPNPDFAELVKLTASPTNGELDQQIREAETSVSTGLLGGPE